MNPLVVKDDWHRLNQETLRKFRGLRTTVIGDVMHRMGCMSAHIARTWPGAACLGSVLPVWTRAGDNAALHEALALAQPGDVMVVNGQGDMTRALFGELMALRAQEAGMLGVVIDGAVRDRAELAHLRFPAFARGATPAGPYKNGPGVIGSPIAVGGVVCSPGDLILTDDDGVVVVPANEVDNVSSAAWSKERAEQDKREAILNSHDGPARK